jgi:hypothetical protein
MVVQLESQSVVLPLRSLAREFGLDPESADGKMLNLIEQALDFVVAVKIGDTLPPELQGIASWDATDNDMRAASSRMWHSLVRCVFAKMGQSFTIAGGTGPGWESDHANQQLARDAIAGAAKELGDSDPEKTRARVAAIIAELAYIEAMRRILNRGISTVADKLMRRSAADLPAARRETMKQVQLLARRGIAEINRRFDEIDAGLDDVLTMLKDVPGTITDMRKKRDWLFRINRSWTTMFNDWQGASNHFDEFLWKVVERSYTFLAPRYMPYQEWTTMSIPTKDQAPLVKVW